MADILYSDLGPGNTWIINRDYQTNFDLMATPFVATGSGNLGDIEIPVFSLNSPVNLALYTDSGNGPDTLLEDWNCSSARVELAPACNLARAGEWSLVADRTPLIDDLSLGPPAFAAAGLAVELSWRPRLGHPPIGQRLFLRCRK